MRIFFIHFHKRSYVQILSYGGSHHGFLIDNKTLNFLEDFFYVTIPSHIQFLRGRFKIIKCKWPGMKYEKLIMDMDNG